MSLPSGVRFEGREMIAEWAFWACAGLAAYVYVGYPLLARVLARAIGVSVRRAPHRVSVTVIIAAHNEERDIGSKIDNVLALDYPPPLLDVVIVSDASSDGTDAVVRSRECPRVRLLRVESRVGKTACQNAGVAVASGEILVFTDATTLVDRHAITALTANFADPAVGCAAGSLVYVGKGRTATARGATSYWSYEQGLRASESALGSLVGVSGCLYAVRRAASDPIPPELMSDLAVALRIRKRGLRTVLEPGATCYETTLDRADQEFSMRVRVALRSMSTLVAERQLLDPSRYGWFAWQIWSHKVLRYLCPVFCAGAFGTSMSLSARPGYLAVWLAQVAILAAGALGLVAHSRAERLGFATKAYYFLLANAASLVAMYRFARGERMVAWEPVR